MSKGCYENSVFVLLNVLGLKEICACSLYTSFMILF